MPDLTVQQWLVIAALVGGLILLIPRRRFLSSSTFKKEKAMAITGSCRTDPYPNPFQVCDDFGISCPARMHAIYKLLTCGTGKNSAVEDLQEVANTIATAIELEQRRTKTSA